MTIRWRHALLGLVAALAAVGFGILLGVLIERLRFDERRTAVVSRYEAAVRAWQAERMEREHHQQATSQMRETPWSHHLRAVSGALANHDVKSAERAWERAYLEALGSRQWEGMADVGDAAVRLTGVEGARLPYKAMARSTYLAALFLARSQSSLEGVLRTAEGFAALGDRDVVTQCLRIAEDLPAARQPAGRARIAEFARSSRASVPRHAARMSGP